MILGKLSEPIKFQSRQASVDSIGQPVEVWQDEWTDWADVRHLRGLETLRAGAETSVVKASFRIRFRDGVTAGMRVVWNNVAYNITAALPQGRRSFIDLACERVTDVPLGD
jgi:SPP1 family predicted phage head-tail adaptor